VSKYHNIYRHYEGCLQKEGDTHLGVDWPNMSDLQTRFDVMLDVRKDDTNIKILDFGCGTGLLYSHLKTCGLGNVKYSGLDISTKFIDLCKTKFPEVEFYCLDVNVDPLTIDFDYAICNGTFTEKLNLTFDEMFDFFSKTVAVLFEKAKKGIAFNVMSNHVDWKRDDLFHVPHDFLMDFVIKNLSRNYVIRNDYGLYEYTVYVYKESH